LEFAQVVVDATGPSVELFSIAEKISVVIQILDVYLKSSALHFLPELSGNVISSLRHKLEGGFQPDRFVEPHHFPAKGYPIGCFDVMSHRGATLRAVGPKPNEGHCRSALGLHAESQRSFEDRVYGRVHRPLRKWQATPAVQIKSLKMFSYRDRHPRPKKIVNIMPGFPEESEKRGIFNVVRIALETQVVHDFIQIKRQANHPSVQLDGFE
jgi:hypothetical protein